MKRLYADPDWPGRTTFMKGRLAERNARKKRVAELERQLAESEAARDELETVLLGWVQERGWDVGYRRKPWERKAIEIARAIEP